MVKMKREGTLKELDLTLVEPEWVYSILDAWSVENEEEAQKISAEWDQEIFQWVKRIAAESNG